MLKSLRQSEKVIENFAGIAQLVERLFCKQMVGGSIPLAGFKIYPTSGVSGKFYAELYEAKK